MPDRFQISCINKTNRSSPYECISHVGGISGGTSWKLTLSDAIYSIEIGKYAFYTSVAGHIRNVIVASRNGSKYLKTESDHDTPDNLLSLPECA